MKKLLFGTWTDSRTGINQLYFNRKNFSDVLGTEEIPSSTSLTIFPQPAHDYFFVKGIHDVTEVEIINVQGIVIENLFPIQNSAISISSLTHGIYLVHVKEKESSIYLKLVVQ